MSLSITGLVLMLLANSMATGEPLSWTIESPDTEMISEPVFAEIKNPGFNAQTICLVSEKGVQAAQVEHIGEKKARVWWLATQGQGESVIYRHDPETNCGGDSFSWENIGPQSARLGLSGRPVIQYEFPVFDPDDIKHTKKPFHHVFSPSGERFITKGPGGRFSHHRGIYLGYYAFIDGSEKRVDIWHARNGERSEHNRVIRTMEGPVMGGHVLAIDWKDHDGEVFVTEEREVRSFRQPAGQILIDVRSRLTAHRDHVLLAGDRHHAGLQFRAAQEVAENPEATRFIRPQGWNHIPSDTELGGEYIHDFPWNSMYFEIDGKAFTVAYLSHPTNPAGAEMSERLYGRFGEFFAKELERGQYFDMNYRFWIKEGDDAPDQTDIQRRFEIYAYPPKIKQ